MKDNKPKILIISPNIEDPQSITLYEEIQDNGGVPLILALQEKGKEKVHKIYFSNHQTIYDVDLESIKAVYVRCLNLDTPSSIPPLLDQSEFYFWKAKYLRENIKINVFFSLLNMLERKGTLVINPPASYFHHNTKAQFFYKLTKEGISVPYTLSTNEKKYSEKNVSGRKFVVKAAYGVGGTRRLKLSDLKNDEELSYCPAVFQEEIHGDTIRVHTVGDNVVLALRIFSEDIDSRTDTKGFEIYEMSDENKNIIIKANKILGIHFSAWDVIIDNNSKMHVLDCNTGPYIWWISPTYARFVMKQLAAYLTTYAKTGDYHKANRKISTANDFSFSRVYKFDNKVLNLLDDTAKNWKMKLRLRN